MCRRDKNKTSSLAFCCKIAHWFFGVDFCEFDAWIHNLLGSTMAHGIHGTRKCHGWPATFYLHATCVSGHSVHWEKPHLFSQYEKKKNQKHSETNPEFEVNILASPLLDKSHFEKASSFKPCTLRKKVFVLPDGWSQISFIEQLSLKAGSVYCGVFVSLPTGW